VTWASAASNCLPALTGSASTADGAFTALTNPQGKPVGYYWSFSTDLSAAQNHWNNHIACDGSVSIDGCPEARTVNVTLSVGGACLAAGGTCADSETASLGSVQDPDVVDTNCECNIGACVSACQAGCSPHDPACSQCCECDCKQAGYDAGNEICAPQPLCYTGTKGHAACLP
jgi:hypothetical protein